MTRLDTYTFDNLPLLGTTEAGQQILLGGFSGLWFAGFNEKTGALQFITHPDRGPNPESVDSDGDGINERPFALPTYQARLVRFELNPTTNTLTITEQLLLTRADGTPISGLPNLKGEVGFAYFDELPIDLYGRPLANDPYGADLEGIVQAEDGTYWMADEYRPAIFHFDGGGVLIDRYVPEGSNASGVLLGTEAIPAIYAQRRANRGFEAITYEKGILYLFLQSPLDNPDRSGDENAKASKLARILAFDTVTATAVAEYLYELDTPAVEKISDAVALGDGEFLAIESDDAVGPQAQKFIYKINLEGATNLLGRADLPAGLEPQNKLEIQSTGIVPVQKSLYVDLSAIGYIHSAKIEGMARIDENTLAVINDNDFGIGNVFDPVTGLIGERQTPNKPVLGIIHLYPPA
jgi:hypothetical protein